MAPSGGFAQAFTAVLLEVDHVQIAIGFQPILVDLDRQCSDQAQTAWGIGNHTHDVSAPLDLLVHALRACWSTSGACGAAGAGCRRRTSPRWCPRPKPSASDNGPASVPATLRGRYAPPRDCAGRRASVAPAGSRCRACVACDPAHSLENVRSIAARRLRQDLGDRLAEPGVIVADDELHAVEAARPESQEKILLRRAALPVGQFHHKHLATAVPVHPQCDQHCPRCNHAVVPHPLVAGISG